MLKACTVCGDPSSQARCPAHRTGRNGSTRQSRKQRQRIIIRDGYECQHCKTYLTGDADTHVDHVVSLATLAATYGTREANRIGWLDSNLQTLCGPCNLTKGSQ
jgi:5-methylcytosine-specific restriction endonuclease McrA